MTKHAAARMRASLRANSAEGLSVFAFFFMVHVPGLLAPQASFAAATGWMRLETVRRVNVFHDFCS